MSTSSPQQTAAAETAQWQSQLASQLSGITIPELSGLIGPGGSLSTLLASTKGGTVPSTLDANNLSEATGMLNKGYNRAENVSAESIGYQALRAGEGRRSPGATSSAIGRAATSLERDRMTALNNLKFSSSMSSMTDFNQLLQLMGQGTQTSLGLASGFGSATGSAIGGMSNQSPFGTALGAIGAVTGIGTGLISGGLFGRVGGH